ncbi:MAG TPA: hypothetical protein PKA88_21920, partial [Polyangiaceae bacterium]|nr:hypothetical protein [Polyangiaceae bacterium]
MPRRLTNRAKFHIERLFLRGAHYRLLVIAVLIGLVSYLGGKLVFADGGFNSESEAVWWAFLRLTDPGYLGDDEGTFKRFISTIVTVLGYVLFLGALIAIMTQWLNRTIDTFERGLTPIAHDDHIVILGWTNRTAKIVSELMMSGDRLERFLARLGKRRLHIAILAEEKASVLVQELRERLGSLYDERRITVRTGSLLRLDHLERVDFVNASVIVLPGTDFAKDGTLQSDARVIKALLAISTFAQNKDKLPFLVAEIFDPRKERVARRAYAGDVEVVASRAVVGRLIAQCLLHPGMSRVHDAMLTRSGEARVFIREAEALAGKRYGSALERYDRALLLGVTRKEQSRVQAILCPDDDFEIAATDRLVVLAPDYEHTQPLAATPADSAPAADAEPSPPSTRGNRRVLVLGWSRKLPAIIVELSRYRQADFDLVIVSRLSIKKRAARLARVGLPETINIKHLELGYTLAEEIAALEPHTYDNVLLVASDWWGSSDATDARTLVGCMVLAEVLENAEPRPRVLVELLDPENEPFAQTVADDLLVTPLVLSYQLAQAALRRELGAVFDELFGPGGAELASFPPERFGIVGSTVFANLVERGRRRGELVIGVRRGMGTDASV